MAKRSDTKYHRPCAVMVHGLQHARVACHVARELNVPVELHSAPVAAASLGAHWFDKILTEIDAEFPEIQVEGILDCGESAGLALAALRQGIKCVRYSGSRTTTEKIRDIAGQLSAHVDTIWPVVLDLGHEPDPAMACRDHIRRESGKG